MATKKKASKAPSKSKKGLKKKKTMGERKSASSKAKTYDPSATYKKGDLIYHPKWEDEGEVTEVGKTEDGTDRITVDFAELGPKRLVMKYDLKI